MPTETPTLALSQEYEYDGKKYGPGDAVKVADPAAFAQLRRAELAAQRAADAARQQARDEREARKADAVAKQDDTTEKSDTTPKE